MHNKKKKQWPSFVRRKGMPSTSLLSPVQIGITSPNIYRTTLKLPLKIFIQCLIYKNYSSLIISGQCKETELLQAWKNIEDEYSEHIAGIEGRRYLELRKEVELLLGKIKLIKICANILAGIISEELDEEANEFGKILNRLCYTRFSFNLEDRVEEVQRCINRSKSLLMNLELKSIQLNEMVKKMDGIGEKATEEYFYNTLITLSDAPYNRVPLTDEITTYEFCERLMRYKKYSKQIQEQNNGNKRRR